MLHPGSSFLVVDDKEVLRDMLSESLMELGYPNVIQKQNGAEALLYLTRVASNDLTKVDLVISDARMPKMDGFQLLEAIQANPELRDMPVILISGDDNGSTRWQEKARLLGASVVLQKPFGIEELQAAIEQIGREEV